MQLIQTVVPTDEPITLKEMKEFLRVLHEDDDALIGLLIIAVREHIENITNRQLESATFGLLSHNFTCKLPKGSLQSVEKIEYLNELGDYITLSASSYYSYIDNGIGYIEYLDTPTLQTHREAVKITFIAGYATVPEAIKQYMKVKIATLYENREEYVIGVSISKFGSEFIENILSSYKIRSI